MNSGVGTSGCGMSIGTVNCVCATWGGDDDRISVRVRRTIVTLAGFRGVRVGGSTRSGSVVTDFADLTRGSEPYELHGRKWTATELVAGVVARMVGRDGVDTPPVATYPACYPRWQVTALRRALDRAGCTSVVLMPEAVAAAEWADAEHGRCPSGYTLVYDLGGSSLDVAVVRTESDATVGEQRGVLGDAVRSHTFGGRALGSVLASYAHGLAPHVYQPVSQILPAGETGRLRSKHVHESLRVVRDCVDACGLTIGDVDRVLVTGAAARPPEVARVLGELGRPVVVSRDPAHTVALGAAIASSRLSGGAVVPRTRRPTLVSGAAVASVLLCAAGVLGSGAGMEAPVPMALPAAEGIEGMQTPDTALSPRAATPAEAQRPTVVSISPQAKGLGAPHTRPMRPLPAPAPQIHCDAGTSGAAVATTRCPDAAPVPPASTLNEAQDPPQSAAVAPQLPSDSSVWGSRSTLPTPFVEDQSEQPEETSDDADTAPLPAQIPPPVAVPAPRVVPQRPAPPQRGSQRPGTLRPPSIHPPAGAIHPPAGASTHRGGSGQGRRR